MFGRRRAGQGVDRHHVSERELADSARQQGHPLRAPAAVVIIVVVDGVGVWQRGVMAACTRGTLWSGKCSSCATGFDE